ncbi:hypothetical protein BG004_000861 [Podila humilis]|nr:hypothetical protein BG004_000861 [Podila humilis]
MTFSPKDSTPLLSGLNDTDTIVHVPEAATYTLFCVGEGECTQRAFSVKVSSTDTVDELKKLVKKALSPNYDVYQSHALQLTAVSIPDDPSRELEPVNIKSLEYSRTLRATEILGHIFEGDVPPNAIHIVVDIAPATPAQKRTLRIIFVTGIIAMALSLTTILLASHYKQATIR